VTKRYLNLLAADLRIDRRTAAAVYGDDSDAVKAVDVVIDSVITGLKRANPRVDRDRFWDAVLAP
jgi:hypothetical protein